MADTSPSPPALPLRTIIASQSQSTMYQLGAAAFAEAFPTVAAAWNAIDDSANTQRLPPPLRHPSNHFVLGTAWGGPNAALWDSPSRCCPPLPPKLAVKTRAAADAPLLLEELRAMATAYAAATEAERVHLAVPVAVVLCANGASSSPTTALSHSHCAAALVQGYVKAAPLHSLAYAYPCGITSARTSSGEPSVDFCRDVLLQVAGAVRGHGGRGLFFRDLKLPNVLVSCYGKATLVDFGHCVRLAGGAATNAAGIGPATTHTSAPELFVPGGALAASLAAHACEGAALADAWSLGVVAYEWLYGRRIDKAAAALLAASSSPHRHAANDAPPPFPQQQQQWWQLPSTFDANGELVEAFFSSVHSAAGGRPPRSGVGSKSLLFRQLGEAEDLIRRLLTVDCGGRRRRLLELLKPLEEGGGGTPTGDAVWRGVLAHPFFAGANSWDEDEGALPSCDGDIEDEVDMQTLGM